MKRSNKVNVCITPHPRGARVATAAVLAGLTLSGSVAFNLAASTSASAAPSEVSASSTAAAAEVVIKLIPAASRTVAATPPPSTTTHKWLSGESDTSTVRDGSFAAWRGRAVDIGGTWAANDTPANQIASAGWSISPGNAYAATPRMDYAVGGPLQGETWAQAAAGQFDTRWAQQLRVMKTAWDTRAASNMYIRFAHEMNGNWYSWTVTPGDIANYITAWHRYYNLIQANFPGAKLVWCANAGSSYNYDIRSLYPGDTYVDVVSVDAYNRDPWVNTTAAFTTKTNSLSPQGGPLGLESWRKFALSHGKPLAISEWSNASVNAGGGGGDAPVFMQEYNKWLTANGGTGAGNILYEVLFNVGGYSDHYEMFQQGQPSGYEPQAAAMYKALW